MYAVFLNGNSFWHITMERIDREAMQRFPMTLTCANDLEQLIVKYVVSH